MTAVLVHRITEVEDARVIVRRLLSTARYYSALGDRANACSMLGAAAIWRDNLARAKVTHAACCVEQVRPRPVRLPGWRQLAWAGGPIRPGRWLP